jgi:hypothetical protein
MRQGLGSDLLVKPFPRGKIVSYPILLLCKQVFAAAFFRI